MFCKRRFYERKVLIWLKSLLPQTNSYLDLQVIKMYFCLLIVNRILNSMQKLFLTTCSWKNLAFAQGKLDIWLTGTRLRKRIGASFCCVLLQICNLRYLDFVIYLLQICNLRYLDFVIYRNLST